MFNKNNVLSNNYLNIFRCLELIMSGISVKGKKNIFKPLDQSMMLPKVNKDIFFYVTGTICIQDGNKS